MNLALLFCRGVDALSDLFGQIAKWAGLATCLVSAGNAVTRYLFDYSSNALLEIQWYLFAVTVMLGAARVYRFNEHVRVDVFDGRSRVATRRASICSASCAFSCL